MALATGILNLALGLVYLSYGIITIIDLHRFGAQFDKLEKHFAYAWILMAFTCGPHHLVHGIHTLFENRPGGALDVYAVGVGFPAGFVWLMLRTGALLGIQWPFLRHMEGAPGDRIWRADFGTVVMPMMLFLGLYAGSLTVFVASGPAFHLSNFHPPASNVILFGLYSMIGYYLWRAQLAAHRRTQKWSLSGVSLAIVFPTCAVMHLIFSYYVAIGVYQYDWHGYVIDLVSVPAAMYFLWVVRSMHREILRLV